MKKMITISILVLMTIAVSFCGESQKDTTEDTSAAPADPGKAVYDQFCLSCHGITGEGDGPAGKALQPKPRNFKTEPFKFGDSLEAVMATVSNGSPKAPTMAAFKNMLPPESIKAVAEYVRKLAGKQ